MKRGLAVALIVIGVLAGVGALLDRPPDANYPAGTGKGGITNGSRLVTEHRAILRDTDYVVRGTLSGVGTQQRISFRGDASADAGRYTAVSDDGTYLYSGYLRSNTLYTREETSIDVLYLNDHLERGHDSYYTDPEGIFTDTTRRLFEKYDFQPTETVTRNDTTHIRFEPTDEGSAVSGTVLVREDGLIVSVNVSGVSLGDSPRSTTTGIQFTVTVDPQPAVTAPEWRSKAAEQVRVSKRGSGGSAISGDADCDDFETQAAAQRYHEQRGGDDLDGDGDGIVCEQLP